MGATQRNTNKLDYYSFYFFSIVLFFLLLIFHLEPLSLQFNLDQSDHSSPLSSQ